MRSAYEPDIEAHREVIYQSFSNWLETLSDADNSLLTGTKFLPMEWASDVFFRFKISWIPNPETNIKAEFVLIWYRAGDSHYHRETPTLSEEDRERLKTNWIEYSKRNPVYYTSHIERREVGNATTCAFNVGDEFSSEFSRGSARNHYTSVSPQSQVDPFIRIFK